MLRPFTIHRAETVEHASAMLQQYGPEAAIYAGGTELLVLMKERLAHFPHLIDIKPVPGLAGITIDDAGGTISIGPWRLTARSKPPRSSETTPLCSPKSRRRSPISGFGMPAPSAAACFAEPHSDPATLLVAWDAIFTLRSGRRSRTVAAR